MDALPNIVSEIASDVWKLYGEKMVFKTQVRKDKNDFIVTGLIDVNAGSEIKRYEYIKVNSRDLAQNHVDLMMNAVSRYVPGVEIKPAEWT